MEIFEVSSRVYLLMSIKIYTAWRIRPSKIKEFLEIIREHMLAEVIKHAKILMETVKESAVDELVKKNDYGQEMKGKNSDALRLRLVFGQAYRASRNIHRDPYFDLDCGVCLYPKGKWVYIIPCGEYYIYDDFESPDFAEEYSYWDNTDKPDELTYRQWNTRQKNWEPILRDMEAFRIKHDVVNVSGNFGMGIGLVKVAEIILGVDRSILATFGYKRDDIDIED